ncbi:hypothetical protein [Leucobacter triazinivorans]|uniref:Uncharacterized protein n=1 Tax=Leucobacter triazinivorans TaxID=1784719 RepID=A0A4P6KER2_9MICO|nr:hypothetical protein [Leucobacter triazinivorans]QBE48762.1 hypothetical protein EVS81_07885 [Leucobacter triazinivorans]
MTIKLRAFVFRASMAWPPGSNPWSTVIGVEPEDLLTTDIRRVEWSASHAEAMQAAYKMLADLDAELMNEVHESHASRRVERCGGCRDLGPHRNTPDCEFYTPEAP